MLATSCARCGKPSPLSLATPDRTRCPSCAHEAATSPELRASLSRAAAALATVEAHHRQLSRPQARALRHASWRIGCFVAAFTTLVFPLALCAITGVWSQLTSSQGDPLLASCLCVGPFVIFTAVGSLLLRAIVRRTRALELAAAAIPPARPGDPARCRVCGGDVAAVGVSPVARCGYCAADSLVTPAAMARAASRRAPELVDFSRAISADATALGDLAARWSRWLVPTFVGALVLPLLVLVGIPLAFVLGIAGFFDWYEGAVDPSVRYTLVDTPAGRCVGRIDPLDGGRVRIESHGAGAHPAWVRELPSDRGLETFDARWIVGKSVRPRGEQPGVVGSVHGSPMPRMHRVRIPGRFGQRDIESLCTAGP